MDAEARLLEDFVPQCLDPDFGATLREQYAKCPPRVSEQGWCAYALWADVKLHGSRHGQRFGDKFYDTTFNFCLTHDEQLIASLGFEVEEEVMNIWQIQGIKGQGEHLGPIKWERALVRHAVAWARRLGLHEVLVASVDHISWAQRSGHLDPVRGKLRYDVTAKRCGFRRCPDGYYRRVLHSPSDIAN